MPIEWETSPNLTLRVSSTNAATTVISNAQSHGIAPWLAYTKINDAIHWQSANSSGQIDAVKLHPLSPTDKLVGVCVDDDSLAADIFPDHTIIPIHLDPLNPLPGPAMAYQSLDGIIMSVQTLTRIDPVNRDRLYAAGVTLAVIGDQPSPDWTRSGRLWLSKPRAANFPPFDEQAYAPTFGWSPGRDPQFRAKVFLFGILACIGFSALALWRSPRKPIAQIFLAMLVVFLFWNWNSHQSPIAQTHVSVLLKGISPEIQDRWTYQTTTHDADFLLPADGIVNPVFYNEEQSNDSKIELLCNNDGIPTTLAGKLRPHFTLAVVNRQTNSHPIVTSEIPVRMSLKQLTGPSIYPGFQPVAESAPNEANWPSVILKPRD